MYDIKELMCIETPDFTKHGYANNATKNIFSYDSDTFEKTSSFGVFQETLDWWTRAVLLPSPAFLHLKSL